MAESSTLASTAAAAPEEQKGGDNEEMMHKTKVIQFLGRTTPIILQNDNGPCPLLAICNVLLLKNNLSLSPDIPEVSQEKLLSLVAERLIDSNSNIKDKDAGYVENQQQNIADAIDLLPRLATGIDVNIKFRRIADFEFTRECAIFDLLDIPLYHGWIVDAQDVDTANAIGSKSYNTLMGELVALETQNMETQHKKNSEEDCVDFAAATTATLGVPSPCLSRGRSFDDAPISLPDHHIGRKGDIEEEQELMRVLKLSESEVPTSSADVPSANKPNPSIVTEASSDFKQSGPVSLIGTLEENVFDGSKMSCPDEVTVSSNFETSSNHDFDPRGSETVWQDAVCLSSKTEPERSCIKSISGESEYNTVVKVVEDCGSNTLVNIGSGANQSSSTDASSAAGTNVHKPGKDEDNQTLSSSIYEVDEVENERNGRETFDPFSSLTHAPCTDSLNDRTDNVDEHQVFISNVDTGEPIYEGEESILESTDTTHQNREPMYEGEVVLAEQGDRSSIEVCDAKKDQITTKEGELIQNFLKNSASQLTIYGLFCLQEGLKERELCVFFRNNHFNTMFKFEGELYILATDQGYINQPDLVWEKLNEVNGDTVYMTGNFKEFKVENHGNNSWDEQNAMASTADYLASMDNSMQADSSFNSDLQLAIALQQQEFEQQTSQRQNNSQPPSVGGGRLVTGPQVPRNSGKYASQSQSQSQSSRQQETKSSKDKCVVM
ncbi:uncharacterized protein [Coffea arabica]|uniref:Uncharacterized protein isoform X1 n=1 Tax=Coffea arabica TaxID=13443 RepID=A0A6P6U5L6_COFAR|nr:ubiquitin carboxyl-terminal hydrolase MINDY-1-like isoform X1 [Coffea arabica]